MICIKAQIYSTTSTQIALRIAQILPCLRLCRRSTTQPNSYICPPYTLGM